jgi:hypothetical protein
MKELKYGSVTITLPDELELIDVAGKLDAATVARMVKAPAGLGQACLHTAESMEKAVGRFNPPSDVTPASLREAGQKAEKVDQVLQDLNAATTYIRQSSLMYKQTAYEQLRKTNDAVKAQGKYNRECYSLFSITRSFFKKLGRRVISTLVIPATTKTDANAD